MASINFQKITAKGEVRYYADFPRQEIGGYSNPREVTVAFEPPKTKLTPLLALLELDITGSSIAVDRWRLWFNNIAIAREIKPITRTNLGDSNYVKAVFDISPLLEGRSVESYFFRIRYMHATSIELVKVGMLLVYEEEGSQTELEYQLTPIILNGNESVEINTSILPPYLLHITGLIPGRSSIEVGCGETSILEGFILDSQLECREKRIIVKQYSDEKTPAIVSSILAYRMERPEPEIKINIKSLQENLEAVIENTGTAPADNIIVLVIAAGNVLYRAKHEKLLPMEKINVKVSPPSQASITIRVIAKYKGETRIYEKKIKMK